MNTVLIAAMLWHMVDLCYWHMDNRNSTFRLMWTNYFYSLYLLFGFRFYHLFRDWRIVCLRCILFCSNWIHVGRILYCSDMWCEMSVAEWISILIWTLHFYAYYGRICGPKSISWGCNCCLYQECMKKCQTETVLSIFPASFTSRCHTMLGSLLTWHCSKRIARHYMRTGSYQPLTIVEKKS